MFTFNRIFSYVNCMWKHKLFSNYLPIAYYLPLNTHLANVLSYKKIILYYYLFYIAMHIFMQNILSLFIEIYFLN